MTELGKRRAELEAKMETPAGITAVEMAELISISPPGQYVRLPDLDMAGPTDVRQAIVNVLGAGTHAERAFSSGFYIEVLALRSQSLELFLRMYLAAKTSPPSRIDPGDKRSLGGLIADSEAAGFPPDAIRKLRDFNRDRIDGVHKYLLGKTRYEDLKGLCERTKRLTVEIVEVLAAEVGTPLTGQQSSVP